MSQASLVLGDAVGSEGLDPEVQAAIARLREVRAEAASEDWPYPFPPIVGGRVDEDLDEDEDEDDEEDEDEDDLDDLDDSDLEDDEPDDDEKSGKKGKGRAPEPEPSWLAQQNPEVQEYVRKLRRSEAKTRTKNREQRERLQALGGDEVVTEAVAVYNMLRTADGVAELTRRGVAALRENAGYTNEQIAGLTGLSVKQVRDVAGGKKAKVRLPDQDKSGRPDEASIEQRLEQLLDRKLDEKVLRPDRERRDRDVGNQLISALRKAGYTDEDDQSVILRLGNKYVPGGDSDDPEVLRDALEKGIKEFERRKSQWAKQYLKKRREGNGQVPEPLGEGGTPRGEKPPKFKSTREATKWLKEHGRI